MTITTKNIEAYETQICEILEFLHEPASAHQFDVWVKENLSRPKKTSIPRFTHETVVLADSVSSLQGYIHILQLMVVTGLVRAWREDDGTIFYRKISEWMN